MGSSSSFKTYPRPTPCQPVPPDQTRRTRPRAHGSRKTVPRSPRHQPPLASSVHTRFYLGVLMARRKADRYSHCHALCLGGRGTCPTSGVVALTWNLPFLAKFFGSLLPSDAKNECFHLPSSTTLLTLFPFPYLSFRSHNNLAT
jgi:hypothetical protein